jgi:hypothetical protein
MKKTPQKLAQVRKALSGQTIPPRQTAAIRGGDGDDNQESYPWVDKP